jgi:hypothetical protein
MASDLRRIVQVWWWATAPPFVAGVATARVGLALDDQRALWWGLGLSTPFLLGVYLAIGGLFLLGLAHLVYILPQLPSEIVRQYRRNRGTA